MELLRKYQNGDYLIKLYEDGTLIRKTHKDNPQLEWPCSIDVKITDYCDLGCAYCHESSTEQGKHADLAALLDVLEPLPAGVELAIGGGNPLAHPLLGGFLQLLKEKGIICNLTVNQGHLARYVDTLTFLLKANYIKGLGVSITSRNYEPLQEVLKLTDNVVCHVIAGVNSPDIVEELASVGAHKVLILGYKTFGRGTSYYNQEVKKNLENWYRKLNSLIGNYHLSFDNLAIQQLCVDRFFSKEDWATYYMGDDGQYTMYIDAVKQEYAKTSRSAERTSFNDTDLRTYFHRLSRQ